jgi:hypothetical protein
MGKDIFKIFHLDIGQNIRSKIFELKINLKQILIGVILNSFILLKTLFITLILAKTPLVIEFIISIIA